MASKNYYNPLDAAILWSNLQEYYVQITELSPHTPHELKKHFPQWPDLQIYTERIYDAVARQELPASYLGQPLERFDESTKPYITIRHSDFRIWIEKFYPDDKPAFLSTSSDKHATCISLATFLTQKAHLDFALNELEILRRHLASLEQEISPHRKPNKNSARSHSETNTIRDTDPAILYRIIGSLLAVCVGKSKNGRVQSIYKNQAALVDAITLEFAQTPGLSKRTLDRKFAEARRHLDQALRQ